ncbi:MAG: hypothetical protein U9R11_03000, partial [Chloroflexota bacterium]|nr:hypothetical protein [Chloroflexota bacterium]
MSSRLKTVIGQLDIVEGISQERASNMAVFEPAFILPSWRGGKKLYLLLELTGPREGKDELCERLVEIGGQEYFKTPGSITAGLRQAIKAINLRLLQENLNALPGERRRGGITCLVLRGSDLFIGQAGPALAYVAHGKELQRFPPGWWQKETTVPLGTGDDLKIGFFHHQVSLGDVILVAESDLAELATPNQLLMALAGQGMSSIMNDLEELVGQGNLSAMAIGIVKKKAKGKGRVISQSVRGVRWPSPRRLLSPLGAAGRKLASIIAKAGRDLGHGVAMAIAYLLLGMKVLLRRTLPGPEGPPPIQRPMSEDDQALWRGVAVTIPILVALVVMAVYWQHGRNQQAHFEALVQEAREERTLALSNPEAETAMREHLQKALDLIAQAKSLEALDEEASPLEEEIQKKLDELDKVNRLYWIGELWTYEEPGSEPCQVIADDEAIYVLDKGTAKVYKHPLGEMGMELREPAESEVVLRKGQSVEDLTIGEPIDIALVPAEEGRSSSSLFILESGGALWVYDPRQGLTILLRGEEYKPQLMSSCFGDLYLLDRRSNQILRYHPVDEGRGQLESYLPLSAQVDLSEVVDMAV